MTKVRPPPDPGGSARGRGDPRLPRPPRKRGGGVPWDVVVPRGFPGERDDEVPPAARPGRQRARPRGAAEREEDHRDRYGERLKPGETHRPEDRGSRLA